MNAPRILALGATLALAACTGTTVRERMPAAADTIVWSLVEARDDLAAVRVEIDGASLDPAQSQAFHDACDRLDADIFALRVELDRAETTLDTDDFERVAFEVAPLFERIAALRGEVVAAAAIA